MTSDPAVGSSSQWRKFVKSYANTGERRKDFLIAFFGWFICTTLIWLFVYFVLIPVFNRLLGPAWNATKFNAGSCTCPSYFNALSDWTCLFCCLSLPTYAAGLAILWMLRRWMAAGLASALVLNTVITPFFARYPIYFMILPFFMNILFPTMMGPGICTCE